MLELNIYQNTNEHSRSNGKYYARVETKKQLSIHDMALHMAEHNTPFSVGTVEGILRDFVNCTREQCLQGNTVKIDNLAIFKCSASANGMTLGEGYKIVAGLGSIPTKGPDGSGEPDFTKQAQYALKSVRLQATATGEFSKKELNDDVTLRWTKAARDAINAIVNPSPTPDPDDGD